ncbi:hypothetical protein C8F01DRAFT_1151489 [Mycena amicta]|nr:hypothetical protein C8F01DRAFT_1151489 [Mycena amicta]
MDTDALTIRIATSRNTTSRNACSMCGKTNAPSRCSGCLVSRYCGTQCQRTHWSAHKSECIENQDSAKGQIAANRRPGNLHVVLYTLGLSFVSMGRVRGKSWHTARRLS